MLALIAVNYAVLSLQALSFAGSADTVEALTRFNAELGRSGLTFLPEMLTALQSMSLRGEGTGQAVELALVPLQAVIESPEVDVLQQCCAAACSLLLRFLSQLRVPKDDIGPVVSAMLAACAVAKDACDVVTRTSAVCPVVLADLLSVCRSQPATLSTMYFISHCVSVGLAEPSILVSMCRPNPQHITQLLLADTSHPLFLPTVQAMLSVLDCHEIDHQSMAGLVAVLGSVCEGVGPWTPSAVAIQALLCASLVQVRFPCPPVQLVFSDSHFCMCLCAVSRAGCVVDAVGQESAPEIHTKCVCIAMPRLHW